MMQQIHELKVRTSFFSFSLEYLGTKESSCAYSQDGEWNANCLPLDWRRDFPMIMILPFIGEFSRMGGVKQGENVKFVVFKIG